MKARLNDIVEQGIGTGLDKWSNVDFDLLHTLSHFTKKKKNPGHIIMFDFVIMVLWN